MPLQDNRQAPGEVPPLGVWFLVLALLALGGTVAGLLILSNVQLTDLFASLGSFSEFEV